MLTRTFKKLGKNENGTSVVEFAFAAPLILGMIFGSVELGYMTFARSQLESAVTGAAREAISGAASTIINPSTNKPYTRDRLIQKRVREAMDDVATIDVQINAADPAQGNPRLSVTPYSSIASGGAGFSKVRQPEPMTDVNLNNACDLGLVPNSAGVLVRETFSDANGNGKWDNGGSFGGAGAPGDIVVYDIEVDSPLLFGGLIPIGSLDENGNREKFATLKSQVVVQNELWAAASSNARITRYCDGSAKV
jgi:Flp pilus assembly protein TadG